MSARVDPDPVASVPPALVAPVPSAGVAAIAADADERFGGHALPNDHPAWMKDTLSLSQRARALLAKLPPVVLRVAATWDHRVRSIVVAGSTLRVDASGSYRFD